MRVGVVGMGIGHAHLLSWLEVEGADAVIVADTDRDRAERAGAGWRLPWTTSLDDLLDAGVDVVDLCTPPRLHEAQIIRCLDAGVHVICEKPLVDSIAACRRLADAAAAAHRNSGAVFMPIMQYRFGTGAAQARALIDAGLTGRLFTASAATWWRRDRNYYDEAPWRASRDGAFGGTLVNHSMHVHDLLTWIGGPVVEVSGRIATRVNEVETEDCAVGIARTAEGALLSMNVTLGAVVESSRLAWHFERLSMESSTEAYDPARGPWRFDYRDPETAATAAEILASVPNSPGQYVGQFQGFVDAVGPPTDGADLPVTLADATAAVALAEAWYESAATGSWVPVLD